MSTYVRLDPQAIRFVLESPAGPVMQDLLQRGNRVKTEAQRQLTSGRNKAVDTGRLRASIAVESGIVDNEPVARVGTNVSYALFVHDGTAGGGTGWIYPRRARVLRWPVTNNAYRSTGGNRRYRGGRTAAYAFAPRVRGMRPRPFLRDALPAAK